MDRLDAAIADIRNKFDTFPEAVGATAVERRCVRELPNVAYLQVHRGEGGDPSTHLFISMLDSV